MAEQVRRQDAAARIGVFSRRYLLAAAFAALVLVLASAAALLVSRGGGPGYRGTVLDPPLETLPFRLTSQAGQTVAWSDYRGRAVILTFLYTNCPDICPLTTAKLHRAHELLGKDSGRVAFVAITVDPERDTVGEVRRYSQERDMLGRWDFLVGSEEELRPLWQTYWASPTRAAVLERQEPTHAAPEHHLVEHGVPVHLIDAQGHGRIVFGADFQPEDLVADIRALLRRG
ncbi:MAG: SCO family protein [Chloroflexi bacterium]|nr:SCO family protein [Chloroflexota bacterium]